MTSGQDYRLRLPAGIPAKDFWSVTVYDAETRSLLQNGRPALAVTQRGSPRRSARFPDVNHTLLERSKINPEDPDA
jgi:hypothetical protein